MARVLIVCNHHPVGCGRYISDALRRQGAEVRTVGPEFGREIWGMNLEESRVWKADGAIETVWADWMPELVIYSMQPPFQFNEHYRGVPHVVFTVDNHVYNFRDERIDHYFLAHLKSRVMPIEGPSDTWLPCAYDPAAFTPSKTPWKNRLFDVALIGVMYPHRLEIVRAMQQAGFKVMAGLGAIYDEYRNIYHQARISLCPSFCGDVGQRVFETAAMKCLVLSDLCADYAPLKADGIAVYDGISGAVEKVRYWLAHPAEAEAAIERSSAWAKPHTWDARAEAILRWLAEHPVA
ncbi:MAG: glycosyltransferase [Tepidisphaeraceae bacterium]